jgi:hypothetical protein
VSTWLVAVIKPGSWICEAAHRCDDLGAEDLARAFRIGEQRGCDDEHGAAVGDGRTQTDSSSVLASVSCGSGDHWRVAVLRLEAQGVMANLAHTVAVIVKHLG